VAAFAADRSRAQRSRALWTAIAPDARSLVAAAPLLSEQCDHPTDYAQDHRLRGIAIASVRQRGRSEPRESDRYREADVAVEAIVGSDEHRTAVGHPDGDYWITPLCWVALVTPLYLLGSDVADMSSTWARSTSGRRADDVRPKRQNSTSLRRERQRRSEGRQPAPIAALASHTRAACLLRTALLPCTAGPRAGCGPWSVTPHLDGGSPLSLRLASKGDPR